MPQAPSKPTKKNPPKKPNNSTKTDTKSPSQSSSKKPPTDSSKTSEKQSAKLTEERKHYDKKVSILSAETGNALTDTVAKGIMGWQEEIGEGKFDNAEVMLKDENSKRIRCCNNTKNRPYDPLQVSMLMQEILKGNYQLNMENLIIGEWGAVLSAQHRLIALILACQVWEKNPADYPFWKDKRPTIDTTFAIGCSEDDKVVNTMDTGKPRSFADVIYRSHHFAKMVPKDRKFAAKRLEAAVRMMWERTGASENHMAAHRTHAEGLEFIRRHPKLVECVVHISDENSGDGRINEYLHPGKCAALMYLMASSTTERNVKPGDKLYGDKGTLASEKLLDFEMWDKASEFWVVLGNGTDKTFKPLEKAISTYQEEHGEPSADIRTALLIKAWLAFAENGKLVPSDLNLGFTLKNDRRVLESMPCCGGIDLGKEIDQPVDEPI